MRASSRHKLAKIALAVDQIRIAQTQISRVYQGMRERGQNQTVRLIPMPRGVSSAFRDWRLTLKANRERAERERMSQNRAKPNRIDARFPMPPWQSVKSKS